MTTFIKLILAASLTFALLATTGCNTFKGLGEDVEALGEKMQGSGD